MAVSVTVRVDEGVKGLWKELADNEDRTYSSYLERLIKRENDSRTNGEVTLGFIASQIEILMDRMDRADAKKKQSSPPKLTAMNCELFDGLDPYYWGEWITHLHKCDVHPNYYLAQKMVDQLVEFDKADYDVNVLIQRLIDDGAKKLYIPFDWKEKPKFNKKYG